MSTTENNEEIQKEKSNNKENVTENKSKKRLIVLSSITGVLVCYIIYLIYIIGILQNGNWETETGDCINLSKTGKFSFYNIGSGSPVDSSEKYSHYIVLNHKIIIIYGQGGINILPVSSFNKEKLIITFEDEKYEFYSTEEDTPTEEIKGLLTKDDIGFYTCRKCHTLMYESKTSYYVSSKIDNTYIGAYKTEDKVDEEKKAKSDKGKKIKLSKDVKYYDLDINTKIMSNMDSCGHNCDYKELKFEDAEKMYDGSPKYAYIWLNADKEAEIVLYTDLCITKVDDDEISEEEYYQYVRTYELDETDYDNICEIADNNVKDNESK